MHSPDRGAWRGQPPPFDTTPVLSETLGSVSLAQRRRWLIGLRLVGICSVLGSYVLFQLTRQTVLSQDLAPATPEADPAGVDFIYWLAAATFLATLVYVAMLRVLRDRPETQAYIQFFGDLLLITGLVYRFGGAASPFSILYFLVIMTASVLLRRRAGFVVATVAWWLHALTVLGTHLGWLPSPADYAPEPGFGWRVGYNLATHLLGFYGVAYLTSRLAGDVSRVQRELVRKRQDLAALRVAHQDIIESINSGLITCDLDGFISSANAAAQSILNLPMDELLNQPIHSTGLFAQAAWLELVDQTPDAQLERQETTYRRGDDEIPIGFTLTYLRSADAVPTGFILIFRDLSEWRRLQEELRIKDRMAAVGELSAGIAHEIGNPLAAVSGSVQMLLAHVQPNSSESALLDIILKESQRLDRTIKGFLRFARPGERATVSFDIAQLLQENLDLLRNSHEVSDGHALELELEPEAAQIVADPDQVSQIFWNLARNALRAMPQGGTLRVEGQLHPETYILRVVDTGRGMTEEQRAKLFQPFQSHFDRGTGIGMSIVYRIVQEHGGHLSVDSEPGRGTSVAVELPLQAPRRAEATR